MISALYLDRISSRTERHKRRRMYLAASLIIGAIALLLPQFISAFAAEWFVRLLVATSCFTFASYVWKLMLEAMYVSLYAKAQREHNDYWTAYAKQYSIFKLPFAEEVFLRLGITSIQKDVELSGKGDDFVTYISSVFAENKELRAFLEKNNVTKSQWIGVWSWLEKRERQKIESVFILSDEHILRMPSIGEAFSYGQTFALSKLGRQMSGISLPAALEQFYSRAFDLLDQGLKKSQGANVILVCESVEDGEEYVKAFIPHINSKKFIEFGTEYLISIKDPGQFEKLFVKTLQEAALAGNIVLVIPHVTSLIHAAHALGYDAMLSLAEYMRNPELHIVMIADKHEYHSTLETNISITQLANKIELDPLGSDILQGVAEALIPAVEYKRRVVFSYQALVYLVDAAARYGSEQLHDTLNDYLDEAAFFSKKNEKTRYVTEAIAKSYIAEKTGIKGTLADTTENNQVINIQEVLLNRVKGQDGAIQHVAQAMERVKAGLNSTKRPLGTFLFLGPTGVGKTETAKALAQAYFGDENKMLRFDMSEFGDGNAVTRLIGAFGIGEQGLLATAVRDAGHGVILFDEIEKANEKVRDLMLQILDEGFFTDSRGERVNMKNFILIATSNAGSAEIYEAGVNNISIDKTKLINHIIEQGIFKPEFLNRFDEIAVFNALGDRQLASIVSLKLEEYAKELYEKKTIHMNISPDVVHSIMDAIENRAFGGREIKRAIQNKVESIIARDIIDGKATSGTTVSFKYNPQAKLLETVYT